MKDYIRKRAVEIAKYMIQTDETVRVIAKVFGVSKSTVWVDLSKRLPKINENLAKNVDEILKQHSSVRHLRGGMSTKLKYEKERLRGC